MGNVYEISIGKGDDDDFTLYENGEAIMKAPFVYHLCNFLGDRYNVDTMSAPSESYQLQQLLDHGVDVRMAFKW